MDSDGRRGAKLVYIWQTETTVCELRENQNWGVANLFLGGNRKEGGNILHFAMGMNHVRVYCQLYYVSRSRSEQGAIGGG